MKKIYFTGLLAAGALVWSVNSYSADFLLEAEAFDNLGGWVVDTQGMDMMGSNYLLAHGLGEFVSPATTSFDAPKSGDYYVWVRTYNWTAPWFDGKGPGGFKVAVNGCPLPRNFGETGNAWEWQSGGKVFLTQGKNRLSLIDLAGFDGRCDAIYLTTKAGQIPPNDKSKLEKLREKKTLRGWQAAPQQQKNFDLVVVGGGIAGMSTAASAARLGLSVALVQNRPILGGNNSSDVRVHLGGRIEANPYHNLGNLQKEFGPEKGGNAMPKEQYEDEKKLKFIQAETNITLFLNYHANKVKMRGNTIQKVYAKHTCTGEEIVLEAPLFVDCTGDATIGFLAGADYHIGREGKDEFNEPLAPETADKMTMGASVQWYSVDKGSPTTFPVFEYGVEFNEENAEKIVMGEWHWETGLNRDQIYEAERIRDYGMLVVYSNWSFLKNKYSKADTFKNRSLEWVAYIAGKRESRRLMGDHVLTENDVRNFVAYPDGTGSTTWSIDLHYPDPKNTKNFPGNEFKAIAKQDNVHPYPVPYRCLYSRNVDNLFMAGRNISVTHIALGTTRVQRTCGILGEVVGMAASICRAYDIKPREVYNSHLDELKALMTEGVGRKDLPNNQTYNEGGTLGDHPSVHPIPEK